MKIYTVFSTVLLMLAIFGTLVVLSANASSSLKAPMVDEGDAVTLDAKVKCAGNRVESMTLEFHKKGTFSFRVPHELCADKP